MNWKHVQLIFQREMTDQLRDRRTLFTITILPLLLYPLIGMLMMQVAQFNRESPVRVRLIGADNWPQELPLIDEDDQLFARPGMEEFAKQIEFESRPWPKSKPARADIEKQARTAIAMDQVDAVLIIEPDFRQRLEARLSDPEIEAARAKKAAKDMAELQGEAFAMVESMASDKSVDFEKSVDASSQQTISETLAQSTTPTQNSSGNAQSAPAGFSNSIDGVRLVANLARDQSQMAQRRVDQLLNTWARDWAGVKLASVGMSARIMEPIRMNQTDTAPASVRRAVLWSKVLPFVMLVWALTGAFYPAIDLCAGEKERGTLETLLSSPARRREIVWGKLGAISVFSIGSALLNLMSMHLTAGIIVKQLASQGTPQLAETLGPMPFHALGWLVLLLIPMAAFFSALALAVAALARSTKEGQYYLMPLLLVTLPLVALPMIPSLELNLGTSLVPVSGAVFLARSLIEGRYAEAVIHLPVVLLVTAACCWISIRWAIRQFESESVMFRESDRWNLRSWIHHLWRDREDTATPTSAVLCGVTILVSMFFAQFLAGSSIDSWGGIVKSTVVVQIGLILTPCLLMAIFLTRSMRRALRIHRPQVSHLIGAVLIGIAMHPSYMALGQAISQVYAIGEETALVLQYFQNMVTSQPLWAVLLLLAIMPAVCEELVFRGFIFGGLLRQKGVLRAIIISALFFGFTHTLLQQSIAASLMGLVLGFIAWRTGGVICTIIVHVINNTLSLTLAWCGANSVAVPVPMTWAISNESGSWSYQPTWIAMSMMLTFALFFVLSRRSLATQKFVQAELA